ncbi:UNVERIFIED_CONTAM: Tssk1b, partial [Trichonephila clavipes]
ERTYLSEPESRYFFRQIVSAINYLHNLEIAHRDVKCENIMLTMDAEIKLIDFGFCKRSGHSDRLSNTFCGSTAYAAPEVLQGVPYDPFMYDIWSLGCVLYVMVTGNMPFDESNVMKMVEDQLNKAISYPTSFQLSESFIVSIVYKEFFFQV